VAQRKPRTVARILILGREDIWAIISLDIFSPSPVSAQRSRQSVKREREHVWLHQVATSPPLAHIPLGQVV
jgi:hypothetical protein